MRSLKMPEPKYLVDRLKSQRVVGLLSRVDRSSLTGMDLALVNERLKEGEDTRAFGIVQLRVGVKFESGRQAVAKLGAKLDTLTAREFRQVKEPVWFHSLALMDVFDPPREITNQTSGRRFTAEVEFGKSREFAGTAHSGNEMGSRVCVDEVLEALDTAVLRSPVATIVGGLAVHGETKNDIDILIKGPLSDELRQVIEFRIGRMLGLRDPDLANRVQFHDDSLGGPFTDYLDVFDLVLVRRKKPTVVQMRSVAKQEDPTLELLPISAGPQEGVYQLHFRGASVHGDLRLKLGNHLVGWTLAVQKGGSTPDVNTVQQARKLSDGLTSRGSAIHKPLVGGNVLAFSKLRHPVEWLRVDNKVFPEGEVGASAEEQGVMIVADRFRYEQGRQEAQFHEYFFTGGKVWSGIAYFRLLVGRGGTDEERSLGRRTGSGETFWTAHLSEQRLPSILSTRAVRNGSMPPDGYSWIPKSLMEVTPSEYRYWLSKGSEAKKIRDELVHSKYFTSENIKVVSGQFMRVTTKRFVCVAPDKARPPKRIKPVSKQASRQFVLGWQTFKGQDVVRVGPSKQVWWLLWEEGSGLKGFRLENDPSGDIREIAGQAVSFSDKALLTFKGAIQPGQRISGVALNESKDTPSEWHQADVGTLAVLDDEPGEIRVSVKGKHLNGPLTISREDPSGPLWVLTHKKTIERWDPDKKDPDKDRTELKPLAIFSPQKPSSSATDPDELIEKFVTPELLKLGLGVEPKMNGRVIVLQRNEAGEVLIYFEDSLRDRSKYFPNLSKAVKALPKSAIVVGEMIEEKDGTLLPRRELGRFGQDKLHDDSGVRVFVWDVLYWDGENFTDKTWRDRRKNLDRLKGDPWRKVPNREVHSESELKESMKWASKQPGSEGAMVKYADGTYTLGGQTSSTIKLKLVREIDAIVTAKELKKPSPSQSAPSQTWIYTCAIGPLTDNDGEWKNVVTVNNKSYTSIGKTFASNVKANVGDVLRVEVTELLLDSKEPRSITWFTPMVLDKTGAKASELKTVIALVRQDEKKNLCDEPFGKALPLIVKSDALQYVLGVVLEPNDGADGAPLDPDAQNDIYSEDEIRKAAWQFLVKYRGTGLMHEREATDKEIEVVESYVAPCDMTVGEAKIRRGTWMLGAVVKDSTLWKKVKSGDFAAWSVDGSAIREPVK